ncbi:hypothetical protein WAE31_12875 (plasmid) [Xanthomonas axonopodis pv. vasculorum]
MVAGKRRTEFAQPLPAGLRKQGRADASMVYFHAPAALHGLATQDFAANGAWSESRFRCGDGRAA